MYGRVDNSQKIQVKPYGSSTARLYIVIDGPDQDDIRFGTVGEGAQSRYIKSYLESFQFTDYRIGSLVSSGTIINGKLQEPTAEDVLDGLAPLAADIYNTNPGAILVLGTKVIRALYGNQSLSIASVRNKSKTLTLADREYEVVPTYSPRYLLSGDDSEAVSNFFRDIGKSINISTGQYVDIMSLNEISSCRTYEEFKSFVDNNLYDDTILTFDYETNAKDPRSTEFEVIGFSVANKGNVNDHKLRGTYVVLKSLDYTMPEDDRVKCLDLLRELIERVSDRVGRTPGIDVKSMIDHRKSIDGVTNTYYDNGRSIEGKIVPHNMMYEAPATLNALGYELKYDDTDDTLVMARLLMGGATGAGLKYQAQNIGYPDWESDLGEFIGSFLTLASPSRGKGVTHIYNNHIINNQWNQLYEYDQLRPSVLESKFKSGLLEIVPVFLSKFDVSGQLVDTSKDNIHNLDLNGLMKVLSNIRSYLVDPKVSFSKKYVGDLIDDDYETTMRHYFPLAFELFRLIDMYDIKMNDEKAIEYLETAKGLCNKVAEYYDSSELLNVMSLISEKIIEFPTTDYSGIIPYDWVPSRLLEKYGAIDAVATYDLEYSLVYRMIHESDNEVNLFKGYEVFLKQHFAGYAMELAGIFWNDEVAKSDDRIYTGIAIDSLKTMIEYPEIQEYLLDKVRDDYLPQVLYDNPVINNYFKVNHGRMITYAGVIRGKDTYKVALMEPVVDDLGLPQYLDDGSPEYKITKQGHVKYFRGGGTKTFTVPPLENVNTSILQSIDKMISDKVKEITRSKTAIRELTPFMNPASTQGADSDKLKEAFSKILITDNHRIVASIRKIANHAGSSSRTETSSLEVELMDTCLRYSKLDKYYENPDDEEEQQYVRDNYVQLRIDMYPKVLDLLRSYDISIGEPKSYSKPTNRWGRELDDKTLYGAYCQGKFYEFRGVGEDATIEYHTHLSLLPFNEDVREDWDLYPDYKFMVLMRLYKKSIKIITSYLNGQLGRSNVYTVDKASLERGDRLVLREQRYFDLPTDEEGNAILPEGRAFLMQHKIGVCTADTGRWRAGMHCLHPDTEVVLADGRDLAVKDMYEEFQSGKDLYVYSVSDTGTENYDSEFLIDKISDIYISHTTKHMVKVTLDNGESFEVTPDHKMVMRDSTYREAQDINVGDSIYPHSTGRSPNTVYNPNTKLYKYVGSTDGLSDNELMMIDYFNSGIAPNNYEWAWMTKDRNSALNINSDSAIVVVDLAMNMKLPEEYVMKLLSRNMEVSRLYIEYHDTLSTKELTKIVVNDIHRHYYGKPLSELCSDSSTLYVEYTNKDVKVTSVDDVLYDDPIPVYSIAVNEKNPSYALSCGVVSKNTIPTGSSVKKIYTSRYQNGVIFQPDFCISRDTSLLTLTDSTKWENVEDLYNKIQSGEVPEEFYLYSWNTVTRLPEVSLARDLRITKYVDEMHEITFDNGQSVRVTDNHPFLIKDSQTYVRADELEVGMSIQPYNMKVNKDGYLTVESDNPSYRSTEGRVYNRLMHKSVAEKFHGHEYRSSQKKSDDYVQMVAHHCDGDKINNHPDNIEVITQADHMKEHILSYHSDPENSKRFSEMRSRVEKHKKAQEAVMKVLNSSINSLRDMYLEGVVPDKEYWVSNVSDKLFTTTYDLYEVSVLAGLPNSYSVKLKEGVMSTEYTPTIDYKDFMSSMKEYSRKIGVSLFNDNFDRISRLGFEGEGYSLSFMNYVGEYKDSTSRFISRIQELDRSLRVLPEVVKIVELLESNDRDWSYELWNKSLLRNKELIKGAGLRYRYVGNYNIDEVIKNSDELTRVLGHSSYRGSYYTNLLKEAQKMYDTGVIITEHDWDDYAGSEYSTTEVSKYGYSIREVMTKVINSDEYMDEFLFFYNKMDRLREVQHKGVNNTIRKHKYYYNTLVSSGYNPTRSNYIDLLREVGVLKPGTIDYSVFFSIFEDDAEFRRFLITNHRITSIKVIKLEEPEPVFDLEVPDNNNFVIQTGEMSGVVVHNSQNEVIESITLYSFAS